MVSKSGRAEVRAPEGERNGQPSPGNPNSGVVRLGQLGNQPPNGNHYEPEDVQRMMRELWEEFVAKNPDMFKT